MNDPDPGVFSATMLNVLREPFEQWLATRDLVLVNVPDEDPSVLIVVPRRFVDLPPEDRP